MRGARGAQRQERYDQRRQGHHADLAAHDLADHRVLLGLREIADGGCVLETELVEVSNIWDPNPAYAPATFVASQYLAIVRTLPSTRTAARRATHKPSRFSISARIVSPKRLSRIATAKNRPPRAMIEHTMNSQMLYPAKP